MNPPSLPIRNYGIFDLRGPGRCAAIMLIAWMCHSPPAAFSDTIAQQIRNHQTRQSTGSAEKVDRSSPPLTKPDPEWHKKPTAVAQTAWQSADPSPRDQVGLVAPATNQQRLYSDAIHHGISITAMDTTVDSVLNVIAEQQGLNVITSGDVSQRITVKLTNVSLADALNSILPANGLTWTQRNNIIVVSNISSENKGPANLQGREMRVFTLDYISAEDAEKIITGMLSPVGQVFINQSMATDHRRTQEQLVVEDLPMYLSRVEEYIAQVDHAPRQVLVEAHVLQINLSDENKHGIDMNNMLRIAGSPIKLESKNFAELGTQASGVLSVEGRDLNGVIEAIKSTTDSKTLASPKIAVLNGQQARIQVGGQIGYLLTTTTQTSTLQSVNFLDVGVILEVTPTITDDGQIVMQVSPEVSTGRINTNTNLPESETTQLQTRIMLADGEAMLIGGLIKETNSDGRNRVPWLGDLWLVGKLFQRHEVSRQRSEIIIALLPRILPDVPGCRSINPVEVEQASTPLFYNGLQPTDRRYWEPELPDPSATRRKSKPFLSRSHDVPSSRIDVREYVDQSAKAVIIDAPAVTDDYSSGYHDPESNYFQPSHLDAQ
ncbi:secretin and TonB N-terminal domain-containing protein [Novipirellula caenicola]|uniref:Type IV pilus biogenesis and competence protein PilQ n=1 Tax=Novipirellula caenicola TaxID=1536901 RepID=A0ABP9VR42_9BACT